MNGNVWLGVGGFGGVPGTIAAFAIDWPLGIVVGIATAVAIAYGMHVEGEADAQRKFDEEAAALRDRRRRER